MQDYRKATKVVCLVRQVKTASRQVKTSVPMEEESPLRQVERQMQFLSNGIKLLFSPNTCFRVELKDQID